MSNYMSNENATSIFTGYANAIKSKQTKTLSNPIVVDGVSQTTVEGCISAIKNVIEPLVELTVGNTYSFGGNDWICAEQIDGGYVLQHDGEFIKGAWPGYVMTGPTGSTGNPWGNADTPYIGDIGGANISDYNANMTSLYNAIKDAELINATYGSGLYIVGIDKTGTTNPPEEGTSQYYYWSALKKTDNRSWVGTSTDANSIWYVRKNGVIGKTDSQTYAYSISPAFNVDASKITLSDNVISIK